MPIWIAPRLAIPDELLEFRQVRASGPGGQNVNKVSNAAELRFDSAAWPALPDAARQRLGRIAGRRMSSEGVIVIDAQRFRSLERNREDATGRLVAMVRRALEEPRPRRPTRPTRASKERRLAGKKRDAGVKRMRGRVRGED
ncbi:MAG TPA: alternative ribosome rescue aminoacyl-tRNA hydrolase ArfB [Steroidobacteraceae bacterium]|nr:alternative ribosome rescue aminoacyl-tRNA hydrolase ArfB [Steroidobacteraceae bacterium]